MLIKFKDSDPRAGTIARMDSGRGQQLVDAGSAVQVREDGTTIDVAAAPTASRAKAEAPTSRTPRKAKAPVQQQPAAEDNTANTANPDPDPAGRLDADNGPAATSAGSDASTTTTGSSEG